MALKITDSTRNGEYRLEVETDDLYSFQMLRTLAWFCRDRVEVVRCKDCKHRSYDYDCVGNHLCEKRGNRYYCEDNDFCSYGEWRVDNATD